MSTDAGREPSPVDVSLRENANRMDAVEKAVEKLEGALHQVLTPPKIAPAPMNPPTGGPAEVAVPVPTPVADDRSPVEKELSAQGQALDRIVSSVQQLTDRVRV